MRSLIFVVIYQGYVKLELEKEYRECWKKIATYFVNECGALGSTLHKTEQGMWLAYSKWPDRTTRDAAWPKNNEPLNLKFPPDIREAIIRLKLCLDEERLIPEICMEIIDEVMS